MKPYIFSILFLLSVTISSAQTEEVILKKSFKVDENTVLNLDLDNVAIVFEESFDDKIHFDYNMTFIRYPKEKKQKILKGVNVKTSKKGNIVTLDVKNSMYVGMSKSPLLSMDSLKVAITSYWKYDKKNRGVYITKDSLMNEIKYSLGSELDSYIFNNKKKYANDDFIKKQKDIHKSFVIRLPNYMRIEIKALHANLTFNYDLKETMMANTFKGKLKFKKILSANNKFELISGFFQAEEIAGGNYKLKNVYPAKIGFISNAKIDLETCRLKIGEIGKNVSITDFDSKIYLYNFHKNFTKFNLKGDYTALNLYKVKETNFSMDVFGLNTTLNMNGTKTSFGASKEKQLTKILQKKRKENSPFLGNIEVILKNGILNIK
ncbi:hypothetical protein K8354_17685 [Polaribacter litorisediminis]|uniref:hypothetical protein n=1 Tax=Polaribacter litorisediminis TaxID=1908341 RepID=UPI001CBD508B|nr:hypothetical protein [Polaribacter litorisediminis]UAM98086.1 hypothetical protein K8354_17685 [Polaribacter litorisediminis]